MKTPIYNKGMRVMTSRLTLVAEIPKGAVISIGIAGISRDDILAEAVAAVDEEFPVPQGLGIPSFAEFLGESRGVSIKPRQRKALVLKDVCEGCSRVLPRLLRIEQGVPTILGIELFFRALPFSQHSDLSVVTIEEALNDRQPVGEMLGEFTGIMRETSTLVKDDQTVWWLTPDGRITPIDAAVIADGFRTTDGKPVSIEEIPKLDRLGIIDALVELSEAKFAPFPVEESAVETADA